MVSGNVLYGTPAWDAWGVQPLQGLVPAEGRGQRTLLAHSGLPDAGLAAQSADGNRVKGFPP